MPTPPENVTTLTCELQNFYICLKVCCVLSDILSSEKSLLLVVIGGSAYKELVVMCGNWNVRQAVSQRVFRVTTFCMNTCFQSLSTLISHVVGPTPRSLCRRRNKLLPQASTRPHTLLLQRATDAVLCVYVKQYYVKRLVTLFEFIGAI